MNHIIDMRKKFPNSNGRVCRYCEQPFTFKARRGTRGKGYQGRKAQITTNFSIDRWDPRLTYEINNVIFYFRCTSTNTIEPNAFGSRNIHYLTKR